ncbi:hypothetical protein [Stappia sp. ES.058]|uniref:hypothetical protein n=1 Tax=Stappia sp. ES.058 TaxID=1881061 RepID=UPI00087B44D3|nr:hypothetical protein [Stappia sp. ES.058]SDU06569.1 hypothetical protein SAMN05428979_1428 [Stappia sp. ES.058]
MTIGPLKTDAFARARDILAKKLHAMDLDYRVDVDFHDIVRNIETCGKHVTEHFQLQHFEFNRENGFCLTLLHQGRPVVFYCSQVFETGDMTFLEHHRNRLARLYRSVGHDLLDDTWSCKPMEEIRGRVSYSGEALTVEAFRSTGKSRRALALGAQISLFLSMMSWAPDWSVGLARDKHVRLGLGYIYGACRQYPLATIWHEAVPGRMQDDAFLVSSREDALYLAECVSRASRLAEVSD